MPEMKRQLLQSVLVIVYIIYFGYPALLRYKEYKTYILSDVKVTNGIPAPSVTFCPVIKTSSYGWKTRRNDTLADVKFDDDFEVSPRVLYMLSSCVPSKNHCKKDIDECIAQNTFKLSDAIIKVTKGSEFAAMSSITNASYWRESLAPP